MKPYGSTLDCGIDGPTGKTGAKSSEDQHNVDTEVGNTGRVVVKMEEDKIGC